MFWILLYNFVCKSICSHGQVVKTSPSHGGIRGSSPLGSTTQSPKGLFCILTGTLLLTQLTFHIKTPDTQGRYSGTRKTLSFTRELTLPLNASPLGSTMQSPKGLFCIPTGTLLLTQFTSPLGSTKNTMKLLKRVT